MNDQRTLRHSDAQFRNRIHTGQNMLNSSASLWLGVTFVVIGAINVWLVLQASARVRDAKASTRLIRIKVNRRLWRRDSHRLCRSGGI